MALYRLLSGKHIGVGPPGCKCEKCSDEDTRNWHVYRPGDIIDTKINLLALNQPPRSMKFEMVDEKGKIVHSESAVAHPQTPIPARRDGLEAMTVNELKLLAAEEEIDLGEATRKEEIIAVIRGAAALSR
jgi:hypothetical protein